MRFQSSKELLRFQGQDAMERHTAPSTLSRVGCEDTRRFLGIRTPDFSPDERPSTPRRPAGDQNAEYLHERLSHSELHLLEPGHFIWEDAADEYAALVSAWSADSFKTCRKTLRAIATVLERGPVQWIIAKDMTTSPLLEEVLR
jgi:hypothetical protein